jgi:hypothetical protein
MAASQNLPPTGVAGLGVAAASLATGIGASVVSNRESQHVSYEKARHAFRMSGPDEEVEREIKSLFRRSRVAFYISVVLAVAASVLFIYGGFLVLTGVTTSHVISVVSSAIPAAISLSMKHSSSNADKRADKVLERLESRAEQRELRDALRKSIDSVRNEKPRNKLEIMAAVQAIVPSATPEQLANIMEELSR